MGGIATKQKGLPFPPDNVSIVAAFLLARPALPPMFHLECFNLQLSPGELECGTIVPGQLDCARLAPGRQDVTGSAGSDDRCRLGKLSQRREVHVIKMGVREKDQVDGREFLWLQG